MARYDLAYAYDFAEIVPTPAISSSTPFQSDITFEIPQPDGCMIVPKNSYMVATLQIVQVDNVGNQTPLQLIINSIDPTSHNPTAISQPFLSNNPLMCLWQNVKAFLDDQEIINYTNVPTITSLYRILCESKEEQLTSVGSNAINLMSQDDADTSAGTIDNYVKVLQRKFGNAFDYSTLLSKHMIYCLKNQFGFDKSMTGKIAGQIPIPLFMSCDDLLYLGNDNKSLKITFNVDPFPNWVNNLVQIAGGPSCTLANGVTYTLTNKSSGFSNCSINVSIQDLRMYICKAYVPPKYIPRGPVLHYMKSFWGSLQNLPSTNNNLTVSMDNRFRMTHIVIAFNNVTRELFKYSPTDISSGFVTTKDGNGLLLATETKIANDATNTIKYIQVNHNGYTYPQTPYNTYKDSVALNNNDWIRMYQDYLAFSDSFRDRSGNLMTFSQYLVNPIIVFRTRTSSSNINNTISIICNLASNVVLSTTSQMYVMGLYDNYMHIEFDEQSRKTRVSVTAGAPIIDN